MRDFLNRGGEPLASERLLLHAEALGFTIPIGLVALANTIPTAR